jgi:hypothetical protein
MFLMMISTAVIIQLRIALLSIYTTELKTYVYKKSCTQTFRAVYSQLSKLGSNSDALR